MGNQARAPVTGERRAEAEAWVERKLADPSTLEEPDELLVVAYLAGDEAGARREREEIVKWIVAESDRWYDPHDKANFRGIAEAIERGEHRGGG